LDSDEHSDPASVLDTENWLDWNGDFDNSNHSKDDWEADNESDIELDHGTRDSEIQEQWDMSAAPNVTGLIWPIQRSKNNIEKVLMTVGTMETRRSKGIKKK